MIRAFFVWPVSIRSCFPAKKRNCANSFVRPGETPKDDGASVWEESRHAAWICELVSRSRRCWAMEFCPPHSRTTKIDTYRKRLQTDRHEIALSLNQNRGRRSGKQDAFFGALRRSAMGSI